MFFSLFLRIIFGLYVCYVCFDSQKWFLSVLEKVCERKAMISEGKNRLFLANICLFNVDNRIFRKRCEICSKLIIKTPERRHWSCPDAFIVNFEHIFPLFLVFLLLNLNK